MSEPGDWAGPELAKDLDHPTALKTLADIGWLPGLDAPEVLGFADPIPDELERPQGIEVRRNPHAQLRDDPQLWVIWDEWRFGYRHEPDPAEYAALSGFHVECLRELRGARSRAEARRLKEIGKGET